MDSYLAGLVEDLVSDLMEGDDDDDEVGRKRGRKARIAKQVTKLMSRQQGGGGGGRQSAAAEVMQLAQSNPAAAQMVAQKAAQIAAQNMAATSGFPQTVGSFLAPSSQRKETFHVGFGTLVAAIGSALNLTQQTQRAIQAERLIVSCGDATTGADQLPSVGISNVTLGAHNLLSSPGVVGPATAYSAQAWYSEILSVPIGQGGSAQISFQRIALTANNGVVTAMVIGQSAQG